MVKLLFPGDGYLFELHTPIQKEFIHKIHTVGTENALAWLATVKNDQERSHPETLNFCWESDGSENYNFELSENVDFTCSTHYKTTETSISIDNLKIGTDYYWRVNGCPAQGFKTSADGPRFIRIDGALNVRDIGGNKIKQGILYRGTAIDFPYVISEEGKVTFREELHIKTQLELRKDWKPNETKSIVPGVHRIYAPYRPYMEVFEEEHKKGICKIMQILADETNYPIFFHCKGGADRTGMIALYLRAIAGESDDDIHTDYELTALSVYAAGAAEGADGFRSRNKPYYRAFLDELQKYAPGEPISACAKQFLLSCGVTAERLEKIRKIIQNSSLTAERG